MEEIEILEDFIKYYEAEAASRKRGRFLSINVDECDIQALENLIKEYKRLKNDNAVLMADMIRKSIADTIPKSKVKEKIEELEKEYKQIEETSDFIIADTIQPKIQVLQELMEDK